MNLRSVFRRPTGERTSAHDGRPTLEPDASLSGNQARLAHQGFWLPRERGTTRNLASAYPFSVERGLGVAGVYMGDNELAGGGGFFFDLFEAHHAGLITAPNMVISGAAGFGKSAIRKLLLYRSRILATATGQRRFVVIADRKGEWVELGRILGFQIVSPGRDDSERVNPMDVGPAGAGLDFEDRLDHHVNTIAGLCGVVLDERVTVTDREVLKAAVRHLSVGRLVPPRMRDVRQLLAVPPAELAGQVGLAPDALRDRAVRLAHALNRLVDSDLRVMFDEDSGARIDWASAPGVVFDLSAVASDPLARRLLQVVTNSWTLQAVDAGRDRLVELILDEAYTYFEHEETARFVLNMYKIGRQKGVGCTTLFHAVSNLSAQVDTGSAAGKMAVEVLDAAPVRIYAHQNPEQGETLLDKMGLTIPEVALLPRLPVGMALYKVGDDTALVRHRMTEREHVFSDTNKTIRRALLGAGARPHASYDADGRVAV